MNTLLERLVSWAQNEEMINQYFTDHGKDCNEAVKEIEYLEADVKLWQKLCINANAEIERLECSLKISQEKHRLCIARVDNLVDAISSGSHSQMMDALYNKQESDDE